MNYAGGYGGGYGGMMGPIGLYGIGQAANAYDQDPEAYAAVQGDRTKQLIAQMLLSQGMQQPQGQMVGRFYVPPSPLQHVGNLAQAGVGAYLMHANDQKRMEMAKAIQDRQKKEVAEFQQSLAPKPVEQPVEGPGAPVAGPAGDMEGPAPTMTTMQPRSKEEVQQAITQAMMGQNPRVREAAKFMAERQQIEEQKGLDREQRTLDRESREEMNKLLLGQKGDALKAQLDSLNLQLGDRALAREDRERLEREKQAKDQEFKKWQTEFEAKTRLAQSGQGKIPPGYRMTADGNLEAIPGGPADTKLQGAFNQDTAQLQSSTANMNRLASTANAILTHPGLAGITGIRGKVPDIPGTDAADARALLNTLKSQVAFDVLQDMRNNSKTGGALGNVSDAEGRRLESNLAALDTTQGIDQFKKQLNDIITFSNDAKTRLQDAYNMKHKSGGAAPSISPPSSQTEKIRKYNPATGKIE
jgi:hypothetical protein